MLTTSPRVPPEPGPSAVDVVLLSIWRRHTPKAVFPVLFVAAIGLGLWLGKSATYQNAHEVGYAQGRRTAMLELRQQLLQNDSIRHEGEVQAVRLLYNVRFFFLGRHPRGWCFLKFADSTEHWSTGWVADMRYLARDSAYALNRQGMVWSRYW